MDFFLWENNIKYQSEPRISHNVSIMLVALSNIKIQVYVNTYTLCTLYSAKDRLNCNLFWSFF